MRNFKVILDLSDCFHKISHFKLREFDAPFLIIFVQAHDPDEVCYELVNKLIDRILKIDCSINSRVLCREIKKLVRFDKIIPL